MYLKALEMQGFKSFPDKTVLEFGKGVTAVVGPNGSGKSNISDAVRWVLGEQSTKSLRGAKMEDVIFSGTNERRPQGYAQVTLKLDNSDSALNNSEKEVSVTRRYYRSGDSAYLINGNAVRLKDVHELFMDTGLGRDGYSMVSQGKIEDMVSAKSENRRDMFEEAAGISHYRYRREDALRRLSQAEENLVRLRDIVTELKNRVGPLEKQSIKAQQFLVYASQRKELEIGLWVNLLERGAQQLREQSNKLSVAANHYDTTGHIIEKLSTDIDLATGKIRDINISLEKIRSETAELEESSARLEALAAVHENSVEHNNETLQRVENDILLNASAENDIEAKKAKYISLIDEIDRNGAVAQSSLTELSEKLRGLKSRDEEYSDEYNAVSGTVGELTLEISRAEVMISASQSSSNEISSRLDEINASLTEKKELLTQLEKSAEEGRAAREKAIKQASEAENALAGFSLRVKNAENKSIAAKEKSEEKKLELLSKQSRLHFLEETEKNMEGYQGSVKAVMKAASRGVLRGIKGTLFQLISVKEQYQTAIETALGAAIQNIVTESENDAKRAINLLKEQNAGRATFLPMSAVKGRHLDEKGLDDCYGFVNTASALVTCDGEYNEIINSLLGKTVVAEDLDCAVSIAKRYNYRFKIVTLDGQVINAGGAMTGGTKISSAGFLARRSEAEKLTAEIEKLGMLLSEAQGAQKSAAEALAKVKADTEGAQADLARLNEEKLRCISSVSLTESKLEEAEKAVSQLENEKKQGEERKAYFAESIKIAEEEKEKLLSQKEEQEKQLLLLSGGRDSLMSEREQFNESISQINLSVASLMQEKQAKNEAIAELEIRRKGIGERAGELTAELESIKEKNNLLKAEALKAHSEAAEIKNAAAKKAEEIKQLLAQRDDCEKKVADARNEERQRTDERERLSVETAKLEERKASLEKEQADTEKKLFDEYALTRREAQAQAAEIESIPSAQKRLAEIRGQIKALGSVNVAAIDEYKEVSDRYEFLSGQVEDVEKSKKELLKMIDELTSQMGERFRERFDAINANFAEAFTRLFGGGSASIVLEDENDILECGIDIKAQPPGKNVKNLTLLSGGEKGLTAIALLFAILKVRPAPFCIFDEVEAALDDVNVLRYAQYVRMLTDETQFILITHRRGTMEEADILYGVTMQEHGVSKLLELKTAEMVEQLKLEE